MARPVWSGVVSFGLVTVPVRLFAATEDHTIHFRQLQRGTSDRIRNKRVNERTGKTVDQDDIVKGYDLGDGEYITVEPEELKEIAPGKSQVIDVSGFVESDEVDPVYFVRAYYLAPGGEGYTKPYELLRKALAESGRIGIATFVMHSREYLVALRAQDGVLALHTLRWADEVRDPDEELPSLPEGQQSRTKELKTAQQLIETMSTEWHPEEYSDTYEDRVRELIKAKANGEEITPAEGPPEATNVVDLTEALERSIRQAGPEGGGRKSGSARRRTRTGTGSGGGRSSSSSRSSSSGRSSSRSKAASKGGGARDTSLKDLSKDELYQRATESGVRGRSRMSREQLLEALGGKSPAGGARKAA
ncbi:Ku protein [Streptomyces iconiensis]|uniref:Non-homologous end joining protein Ku n=1 Tax=Streptomyces iconiensis TaxID=1384038 RepID=A0ABT6ZSZ3_9ACTN|nr:Ku protein [Streptomyces iconiensis]MDJ1132184.1 Ku protein [Streptomyces iconiensis]